jgi:flagellar biosynthesis GTPase FlhF
MVTMIVGSTGAGKTTYSRKLGLSVFVVGDAKSVTFIAFAKF